MERLISKMSLPGDLGSLSLILVAQAVDPLGRSTLSRINEQVRGEWINNLLTWFDGDVFIVGGSRSRASTETASQERNREQRSQSPEIIGGTSFGNRIPTASHEEEEQFRFSD